MLDLVGPQIALVERGDPALRLAQVEEQLLLVRGGAHLHERPGAQDVFLNCRLDPPHRIGGQAEALLGLEALDGLHQADIAFGDHFRDRQAIAAIAHRDLGDETQMRRNEFVGGLTIAMLSPALGEHVLFAAVPAWETCESRRDSGRGPLRWQAREALTPFLPPLAPSGEASLMRPPNRAAANLVLYKVHVGRTEGGSNGRLWQGNARVAVRCRTSCSDAAD